MFDWMNNVASSVGNLFSVDDGFKPDTPMSSPDAIKTGGTLSDLGFFGNKGESEFSLPNSVKEFQNANGLKVDGVINPGGPTENAISNALQQKTLNTTNPLESTDSTLPSNVSVKKTGDNSYQASASFGAKPKTAPKPKIDPLTGVADPLANAPKLPKKSKAQMDKMWEQVAENKKAKTTQEALQGLMKNPLYQKKDQAYVKHVQDEFKRAYPGNVQYDETGKMIQAKPAIGPDQVRAFGQPQQESTGQPTHYSEQTEKAIREKRYSGNEEEAFADMQNILIKDPDGFKNFSQEDRAAYQAYQKKRRQHWRPDRKSHEEEQVKRNAIEASRDAGAGSHIVPEAKREF